LVTSPMFRPVKSTTSTSLRARSGYATPGRSTSFTATQQKNSMNIYISPRESNVLVCQRAFLQNAWLGKGANVQENCYIINSRLEGYDVTAHGVKIIESDIDTNVFVGFNSFLRGRPDKRLTIGKDSIIMPHTIIDAREEPLSIPAGHLVWGMITSQEELKQNCISIEDLSKISTNLTMGEMCFEGSGAAFVSAFQERIHHILEANGAFFNGSEKKGHAQKNQYISFNTIQPYPEGVKKGLYPTISIRP